MIDIVFPNNDEEEFIKVAERLGHTGLLFVYDKKKNLSSLKEKTQLKLYATTSKQVVRNKNPENHRDAIIFGLEETEKDFMSARNSGLDVGLAQTMRKNNNLLGLSFSMLLSSKKHSALLARMKQNILLSKKNHVEIVIASFAKDPWQMRSQQDLLSLTGSFGFPGKSFFLNPLKMADFLNENH